MWLNCWTFALGSTCFTLRFFRSFFPSIHFHSDSLGDKNQCKYSQFENNCLQSQHFTLLQSLDENKRKQICCLPSDRVSRNDILIWIRCWIWPDILLTRWPLNTNWLKISILTRSLPKLEVYRKYKWYCES